MEDVLSVYSRPYDEKFPVICMDEKPVQLLMDVRKGFKSKKDGIEHYDNEYIRNGTASIFMFTEPLQGWRWTDARERRTRVDWAYEIKYILESCYPQAENVVLVMDNLNTHTIASLYETFPAVEAFSLAERLELHYTPKHGSWLNIAEIELSALGRQCLAHRRIANLEDLRNELRPWCQARNKKQRSVDWHFRTEDARIKLKHLYPSVNF